MYCTLEQFVAVDGHRLITFGFIWRFPVKGPDSNMSSNMI